MTTKHWAIAAFFIACVVCRVRRWLLLPTDDKPCGRALHRHAKEPHPYRRKSDRIKKK